VGGSSRFAAIIFFYKVKRIFVGNYNISAPNFGAIADGFNYMHGSNQSLHVIGLHGDDSDVKVDKMITMHCTAHEGQWIIESVHEVNCQEQAYTSTLLTAKH
jgi:hypothetical protein